MRCDDYGGELGLLAAAMCWNLPSLTVTTIAVDDYYYADNHDEEDDAEGKNGSQLVVMCFDICRLCC